MFIPQLFISSSIDWDSGGFHFLAFVNSATIAFVYEYLFSNLLGMYLEVELMGCSLWLCGSQ